MHVIGLSGLIGSGKDTVARRLVNKHNFTQMSWAEVLKDVTAMLFGWDREMLEGATPESRKLREELDPWWTAKLGKPWSPRIAMQQLGTDVLRNNFHKDIWILASLKRFQGVDKVVISDTRFVNEIAAIRQMNGALWHIRKGQDPSWFTDLNAWKNNFINTEGKTPTENEVEYFMQNHYPTIHASEYGWNNAVFDNVIDNNGTLDELYELVDQLVSNLVLTPTVEQEQH